MAKKKFSSLAYSAKLNVFDILKPIKWLLLFLAIVILVGFIVGMINAFSFITTDLTEGEGFLSFLNGNMGSFSSFLSRLLSCFVVLFLLFIFSKSKWLFPLAVVLLFYRAYLLGLNIGLLLKFYGISGVISAVIIIFPIQLFLSIFFAVFYLTLLKRDCCLAIGKWKFVIFSLGLVVIVNVLLFALLALFSPTVILVI